MSNKETIQKLENKSKTRLSEHREKLDKMRYELYLNNYRSFSL